MSIDQKTERPAGTEQLDSQAAQIRLGLNCIVSDPDLRFRRLTRKSLLGVGAAERMRRLGDVWQYNAGMLGRVVRRLNAWRIGAYVVYHPLLPLYTCPDIGVRPDSLDEWHDIRQMLNAAGEFCRQHDIRLLFHPDQWVVPASRQPDVATRSLRDLDYHARLCELLGGGMINIHLGGAYGDKPAARARFVGAVSTMPDSIRLRLTVENDDVLFAPSEVAQVAGELDVPFIYDVHHHRINGDSLTVDAATALSIRSWQRRGMEPCFHIASSRNPTGTPTQRRTHAEFVDPRDFPACWLSCAQPVTVILETRGREQAVLRLRGELNLTSGGHQP